MTSVDRDLGVHYLCHVNENSWLVHNTYLLMTSPSNGRLLCGGPLSRGFMSGELQSGVMSSFGTVIYDGY